MTNRKQVLTKRLTLYITGLFFLSLGVSFSIVAGFGVSPVSSLAYAFTLAAGLSIGVTTVIANVLFIVCQVLLSRRIDIKDFVLQLFIVFLFGFFMDATLFIVQLLPTPETIIMRAIYLIISLYVIAFALLSYFTAKLPLMPYDALTHVVSEVFKLKFSTAKISSDIINVSVAGIVCLIFTQSLGAIGIGTLIAAYFIGKILGWMIDRFQNRLNLWMMETKTIPLDQTVNNANKEEKLLVNDAERSTRPRS